MQQSIAIFADSIFETEVLSPQCALLRHICHAMCRKSNQMKETEDIKTIALNLDKISIQLRHLFQSKTCAFRP